jgi:UDP-galactopyranose mutase
MQVDVESIRHLVVGAGFFGAVIAEHLARDRGARVVVIDRGLHVGGNCYSEIDPDTGIEYHRFGTHIFHTGNPRVWSYIRRFTEFNGYRHQVLAVYRDRVYQMPINLETINAFYGVNLRPFEVDGFLAAEVAKKTVGEPRNLEEKAVSVVGRPLYEAFIRGYTEKQWGRDPRTLPASIIQRLPFRRNFDESYYFDPWQGIPADGYTAVFRRLLDHPSIDVYLGVDYRDIRHRVSPRCLVVYSGSVDRFFDYRHGRLKCRTLTFEKEVLPVGDYQGTAVMNYPEPEVPYTRIHEPRHLHPERPYPADRTVIFREYPRLDRDDNPYYPVGSVENERLLARYAEERRRAPNVVFGGRMGDFRYYDMDKTIEKAMETYEQVVRTWTPS